jgi:hypothetical protein
MTLVAGLSVGALPAFIGDLLISRRLAEAVELPTQPNVAIMPGAEGQFAFGLAQKLVIVRPYLLLAWAGSWTDVGRMIGELDQVLPPTIDGMEDATIILEILDTCVEGSELVAVLIWKDSIYPFGVRTRGFELGEKRIYLLGSGAQSFFEYLETHPEILPEQELSDGLLARAITLRFGARALAAQWVGGIGLESSWGAGFEVAYPDPDGFRKVGNVLFRAWLVKPDGSYHNSGRTFFTRYYGQDLYLSCFSPDEMTYVVRSPVGERVPPPDYERVHPEWTIDTFLVEEIGGFAEVARHHPPHRPVADFIEFENGCIAGWNMDKSYVEKCVRAVIKGSKDEQQFRFFRY